MEKKEKKVTTTAKKATTKKAATKKTSKKTAVTQEIEKLEKALDEVTPEKVIESVPEEIRADVVKNQEELEKINESEPIDVEAEAKKIFENPQPSEEVMERVAEFEKEKELFAKKIEENPEKAEEIVKTEIKKIEQIKKQTEAVRASLQELNRRSTRRDNFTNLWNGMGYDL